MSSGEVKTFDRPDETRPFEGKGKTEIVKLAGRTVGRGIFEPGWRWSTNVKPIAGTDSCETPHLGYCTSGRLRVHMNDGSTFEIGPGDVFAIPPGHDAEVVGDESFVSVDFGDVAMYAKRSLRIPSYATAALHLDVYASYSHRRRKPERLTTPNATNDIGPGVQPTGVGTPTTTPTKTTETRLRQLPTRRPLPGRLWGAGVWVQAAVRPVAVGHPAGRRGQGRTVGGVVPARNPA